MLQRSLQAISRVLIFFAFFLFILKFKIHISII